MIRNMVSNPRERRGGRLGGRIDQLIARGFEALEDSIPPKWMPKLVGVKYDGHGSLKASTKLYGCGAYGCVFPTLDPGVVLKVTEDDTEGEFAGTIAPQLEVALCVKYELVIKIDPDQTTHPTYLLWREAARKVGKIVEEVARHDEYDRDHADSVSLLAKELLDNQHKAAQAAYHALQHGAPVRQRNALVTRWLESCEKMARQIKVPELRKIGDGLVEVYRANRVFFGDLHAGNFGLVDRADGPQWVITDPGHVAVIGYD
jgi:hypothetical protein